MMMYWRRVLVVLWCLMGLGAVVNRAEGQVPTVVIPQGKLTGTKIYTDSRVTVNAYLGVPYAASPTRERRFAAPERHAGWNRTLVADTYAPICLQPGGPSAPTTAAQDQHEDCLYLNVWTPEGANSYRRTAVVVFLEGEGFISGVANRFSGQDLAAEGLVVVTLSYRLNVFGFFCLEHPLARGNLGLLDQYVALLWVRENIETFGGDPRSVTLMGHSAGAASVVYHMVSPRTQGLFHRAIIMSGSVTSPWHNMSSPGNSSRAITRSLGCSLGSPQDVLLCLRAKPAADILRAFHTQYKNGNWSELVTPVIDTFLPESEQYLPQAPETALRSGDYLQVPALTGTSSHEGIVTLYQWGDLVKQSYSDLLHFFNSTSITNTMEHYKLNRGKSGEIREIIKWQYIDRVKLGDTAGLLAQLIEFYSDVQYRAPHEKQLGLLTRSTQPLYVYSFEQSGGPDLYGSTINISGAAHGSELLHLFAPSSWLQTGRRMTPNQDRLSKNIKRLWADFIRQGNPLPGPFGYGLSWKKYTSDDKNIFIIKNNLQRPSETETIGGSMESFWNEFLPRIENMDKTTGDDNPGNESRELQFGTDCSQPFRNAMYTLIGLVGILLVMLIICLVVLKKRAKERDRDLF